MTQGLRHFAVLLFLFVATFASSANADYWAATYDLAPGSGIVTVNPGGTFNDDITGKMTIFYNTASMAAPLTSAILASGQIDNTLLQNAIILTVSGTGMNELIPGAGGTPGVLAGAVLDLAVVADHNVSGFLHCTDATGGTGGFCNAFFGTPASNNIPQTGTGPFSLPNFNFAATAGIGDFTSDASVMTPQASVVTTTTYVGAEVSRTFHVPEPTGLAMLIPGAVLLAGLARRGATRGRR